MTPKANALRETLTVCIRDLGHAWLALNDRNDWHVFVMTLNAAYGDLVRAADLTLLPRVRRETSIGAESALRMVRESIGIAERALRELNALSGPSDEEVGRQNAWMSSSGARTLQVIAVTLNALLCEDNVWRICVRANPQLN